MSRYEVTSVTGFLTSHRGKGKAGTSFHVVDTAVNRRVMGTWRSEDYNRGGISAERRARRDAEQYAERLNDGGRPVIAERRGEFRPNCPRCSNVCPWYALYCADCGTRLYPAWSGKYGSRNA